MPPEVAQAPIVTSRRDLARTSRIRSASCGRRDRALDQREVVGALDRRRGSPRGSRRSRSGPASETSSSSKSSRVSWQPSQEANFQTASFGLRARSAHSSRTPSSVPIRADREDRAVLADERWAELAVAAVADRALHVALERDVDAVASARRGPRAPRTTKRIITSGPQTIAVVRAPLEAGARDQLVTSRPGRPSLRRRCRP